MTVSVVDTNSSDKRDITFPSNTLQSEETNVTLTNTIQIPFSSLSAIAAVSGKSELSKQLSVSLLMLIGDSQVSVSLFSFNNIEEILSDNSNT